MNTTFQSVEHSFHSLGKLIVSMKKSTLVGLLSIVFAILILIKYSPIIAVHSRIMRAESINAYTRVH